MTTIETKSRCLRVRFDISGSSNQTIHQGLRSKKQSKRRRDRDIRERTSLFFPEFALTDYVFRDLVYETSLKSPRASAVLHNTGVLIGPKDLPPNPQRFSRKALFQTRILNASFRNKNRKNSNPNLLRNLLPRNNPCNSVEWQHNLSGKV